MRWLFRRPAVMTDGVIDLAVRRRERASQSGGFGAVIDFEIRPHGSPREAGAISVRLGEGPCTYYFGHIGYHIDPPWRGQHWARRACRLVAGLLREHGFRTAIITCDPDNYASRRTIEGLDCVLSRTVRVPQDFRDRWNGEISAVKCIYIWHLDGGKSGEGTT